MGFISRAKQSTAEQARITALNMLGQDMRYEGAPFFRTDQYGKRFDYLRHTENRDNLTMFRRPGGDRFVILCSQTRCLCAALFSTASGRK